MPWGGACHQRRVVRDDHTVVIRLIENADDPGHVDVAVVDKGLLDSAGTFPVTFRK